MEGILKYHLTKCMSYLIMMEYSSILLLSHDKWARLNHPFPFHSFGIAVVWNPAAIDNVTYNDKKSFQFEARGIFPSPVELQGFKCFALLLSLLSSGISLKRVILSK